MSEVNVKGLAELQKFLDQLPAKVERNILRSSLRQGANVIKAAAVQQLAANGSKITGKLAKGLKVSTRAKGGRATASVKAKGQHAHIAHWLEYGVAAHGVKKGAKRKSGKYQDGKLHPGFDAKPFFRPALDSQAGAAVKAVGETIKVLLTKNGLNASGVDIDIEE